jgi:hypothetical protein
MEKFETCLRLNILKITHYIVLTDIFELPKFTFSPVPIMILTYPQVYDLPLCVLVYTVFI